MIRFKKISTKLGVVFSSLFVAVMLTLSAITYAAVTKQAETIVSEGMVASGSVFTRLFVDHAADIQADVGLQVKDFGFRSAVSSEDGPTINSALTTLQDRLHVDSLTFVDIDGAVRAQVGDVMSLGALATAISDAYDAPERVREPGVLFVEGAAVLVGITPVQAPDIIGWVVFGDFIGEEDLSSLERLAPIRLSASISERAAPDAALADELGLIAGNFSLKQEIPSILPGETAILTLTYPVAAALAPYNSLLATLAALSLAGVAAVSAASWALAGRLTRPISALAEATQRVRRGKLATVEIDTGDELARLAVDFNHMSSEVRERENIIRRTARIDAKTNMPNRLALEERLNEVGAAGEQAYVVSIKIKRFAEIRSSIGFEAASKLVTAVADELSRRSDVRFLAVVSDGLISTLVCAVDDATTERIAQSLAASVQTTFSVGGSCIDIMVRSGVAKVASDDSAASIQQSIIAVEQAAAVNTEIQFFDPDTYEKTKANLSLMGDLVTALESGAIDVFYQPKYDLRTRFPVGVEALVRWRDPARGQVYPDVFIPLAEETGHIEPLTHYVLEKSLLAQAALKRRGFDLCMSVNFSGRLVGNDRFAEAALSALKDRSGEICFEITETAVIADPERGIAAIQSFVDQGVQISIDDYGSGLSSLAYLKRIPASELKIDKCFVLDIDQNHRDALLVRSTVDLAHSLGMKVTAEGIETAAAAALLAGMGCDVGQGYGLGRPMPLDDLIDFLDVEKSETTNRASKAV